MDEEKDSLAIVEKSLKSYVLNDGRILIPMHKIAYVKFGSSKIDDKENFDALSKLNGNFSFCSLTPVSYIVAENEKFTEYKLNENEEINKWTEFLKLAINLLKKK